MIKSLKFLPKDFTTLRTPFTNFFALNLLFQDTSYSLALKYLSFLFKFFSLAFYNINFWLKISTICSKISHFSYISHSRENTGYESGCQVCMVDLLHGMSRSKMVVRPSLY